MNHRFVSIVVLLFGLCVVGVPAFAVQLKPRIAAQPFVPCLPGATVFYVNGVDKPNPQDVGATADELRDYATHFSVTCIAEVTYLHNPSISLMVDVLVESAAQKVAELSIGFEDAFLQVSYVAFGVESLLTQSVKDQILNRVDALIQGVTLNTIAIAGTTVTTGQLVNQFRDRVLSDLGHGTKTVLVAHSQGNFFANETFNAVQASAIPSISRGLAVVNVANASINAPSGLWVSARQDLVIFGLGAFALPAEFDAIGASTYDLWGHGFSEVYLNQTLPTGAAESASLAWKVTNLLQQALNVAQTPAGAILGSTSGGLFAITQGASTATPLGSFTFSNSPAIAIWDIAVNPKGGPAYAISANAVYTFDTASPSLVRLPQSAVGGNALAFNADGELYGMGGNKIYHFDTTSGVATPLPLPLTLGSYTSSGDITFDSDGNMFATAYGPNGIDSLLRIDLNRSTIDVVGSTGYSSVYGLYFSGGYLYGVTTGGVLLNINRSTGAAQVVGQLPFGGITGLQ